jgi:glycosyltransferase involved in cell wall biosynthesis
MKYKEEKNYMNINKINIFSFKTLYYLFIFIMNIFLIFCKVNKTLFHNNINLYKIYVKECKNLKIFNYKNKKINENPFLSICLPVYNMEKYIERAIISIINQCFDDFEIIIINDNSKDKSDYILKKLQFAINKIRIINHYINLGIYNSRVDLILNSKGKYIIFLDPDDLFLNPYLFQQLYDFNKNKNLDIIEFGVYEENDGKNNLYYPRYHRANHYHQFKKDLIFQPELSNILFLEPKNKEYSDVICRCIWNKMIKKEVLYKTINFIGINKKETLHFNYAEDTIMNIINFQYAFNYSNIKLGGYMYNIRKDSSSHKNIGYNRVINISNNILLYFKLLFKYIKHFNKDRNYLFYDIRSLSNYLIYLKDFNSNYFINKAKLFLNYIKKDQNISNDFKNYINEFSLNLKKKKINILY